VTWDESVAEKRGTAELMKEYRTLGRGKEAVTVVQVGDVEAHWRMRQAPGGGVRVSLPCARADGAADRGLQA